MIVHNKDITELGIKHIETNDEGEIISVNGVLPTKTLGEYKHKFSIITDKTLHWAEQGIEYAGG